MSKNKKTSKSNETKTSSQFQRSISHVKNRRKPEKKKPSVGRSDDNSDSTKSNPETNADQERKEKRRKNLGRRNSPEIIRGFMTRKEVKPSHKEKVTKVPKDTTKQNKPVLESDESAVALYPSVGSSKEEFEYERELKPLQQQTQPKPMQHDKTRSLIGLDAVSSDLDEYHVVKAQEKLGRSPETESQDKSLSETKDSVSLAENEEEREIYKKLFREFAMESSKLQLDDIREDFSQLPPDPRKEECTAFNNPANAKKNRYMNIGCLDISRVKLTFMCKNEVGSDYVHANYVASRYLNTRYILTQGPKKSTIIDFWRMVWQEKSTAIVMLCQFVEHNREKCAEYFPTNQSVPFKFDKLILTYEDSTINKSVITTKLKLTWKGESRIVTHYQWKEWPDYQVPGSSETMLTILRKIRGKKTPPIIHCAAGVGRSGTLMAIEIALMTINNHNQKPNIKQIVTSLRLHGRASSVQTLQQYMLISKVVLDFGAANRLTSEESYGRYLVAYRRAIQNQTWT